MLTRDQIINANPTLRTGSAQVEEFGGEVKCRELTAHEANTLAKIQQGNNDQNALAYIVCRGVIDAEDKRVFRDDDQSKLAAYPARLLRPISDKIVELSGASEQGAPEKNAG
ncbi:MAG: hypothetical protein K8T91_08610 [Planctomycetes bacterium]|nr:hypothetical protein [Planctomycetota bacterium]